MLDRLKSIWFRYTTGIVFCAISVVFILLAVILLIKSIQNTTPVVFSSDQREASSSGRASLITIDIEGAVVHAGLYHIRQDARVGEAITVAGGLRSDADTEKIAKTMNLAAKLVDGAKLYIPRIGEDQTSHNNDSLLRRPAGSSQNGSLVNINTDSQSQLEALPGIGPVTAGKIIAGRPYQTLSELVTKKVMSQTVFNKIKDSLNL